jgi:hypothetical protein
MHGNPIQIDLAVSFHSISDENWPAHGSMYQRSHLWLYMRETGLAEEAYLAREQPASCPAGSAAWRQHMTCLHRDSVAP